MLLSGDNIVDLTWWINNVRNSEKCIIREDPLMIIKTDSSKKGWGGLVENTILNTRDFWNYDEQKLHINFLELKAAFLFLKCFSATKNNIHVQLMLDNMVAVNYINKMGGRTPSLNTITRDVWSWCIDRKIWLTACHLPGVANIEADRLSRSINIYIEWKLNEDVFEIIDYLFGPHDIDLFASKLNRQLKRYYSNLPGENAEVIDAFTTQWTDTNYYCFPPFSLISRILQKLKSDKTDMTLLAPLWPTQHWFPQLLHSIVKNSFIIPKQDRLLYQPKQPSVVHPLAKMTGSFSDIWKSLRNLGVSRDTAHILMSSWKSSTKQQYWTYFRKWTTNKLILNCMKPYNHASKTTIARWIKTVHKTAGVDINKYKPHSTR
jgi:hypothetical protein